MNGVLRSPALTIPTGLVALLCIAATAAPSRAQIVPDTLDHFDGVSTVPLIAVDPFDGTPHIGYQNGTAFVHAWLGPSGWQSETAIPAFTTTTAFDAISWDVGAGGRAAMVYDAGGGTLTYAVRESGVWTSEPIVATAGWTYAPSLVFDAQTGEPVVAWLGRQPGSPVLNHLCLGRRGSGGWAISEVDTSHFQMSAPSLALDSSRQPKLAIAREAGPGGGGTYLLEAPAETGPYTWTLVDPAGVGGSVAIALDRSSDEPRIAYGALRYGSRSGGVWTTQAVYNSGLKPFAASLALTPTGDPRIVQTVTDTIFANTAPARVQDACPGVFTLARVRVMLFKRAGAVGPGAFTSQFLSEAYTTRSSARAVTASVADGVQLAWRDPFKWFADDTCFTDIIHATDTPTTAGLTPVTVPVALGLGVSPNPLPSGATLNVRLSLARAQTVELALIDIAGRRVAQTETRLEAGNANVVWAPEGLRAGVYHVIARAGGARIGSAPVIVLR
ncbi:MAG: hypothetical protein ACHQ52_14170 [Candidatus Eisenbacteria bacterium]